MTDEFYFCMLYAGEPEAVRLSHLPNRIVVVDTDRVAPFKGQAEQKLMFSSLNNDFAKQRNSVHASIPEGAWLCWLDADEEIWIESFIAGLKTVMADQRDFDTARITRINTVTKDGFIVVGSIEHHYRIYRNLPHIQWVGKIHEQVTGFNKPAPDFAQLTVNHCKTQERQDAQSKFYAAF